MFLPEGGIWGNCLLGIVMFIHMVIPVLLIIFIVSIVYSFREKLIKNKNKPSGSHHESSTGGQGLVR